MVTMMVTDVKVSRRGLPIIEMTSVGKDKGKVAPFVPYIRGGWADRVMTRWGVDIEKLDGMDPADLLAAIGGKVWVFDVVLEEYLGKMMHRIVGCVGT